MSMSHCRAMSPAWSPTREKAISDLNRAAGPELMPLARLLLRTESIASSKVEGMQVDARSLARAEANQETGRKVGSGAAEILANIDAMQLSIERAADLEGVRPRTSWTSIAFCSNARRTRRSPDGSAPRRTGSAATTTTPAARRSCPRRRARSIACSTISARSSTTSRFRRSSRPRSRTPSSRRSIRSRTATAEPAAPWCRSCSAAAGAVVVNPSSSARSSHMARCGG